MSPVFLVVFKRKQIYDFEMQSYLVYTSPVKCSIFDDLIVNRKCFLWCEGGLKLIKGILVRPPNVLCHKGLAIDI